MTTPADQTPDAILRFLDSIGRRSEAEFYLGLFRAESKERFANLVVDSTVLRGALEAVVLDLRFLHGLGLSPVVSVGLHGEGTQGEALASRLVGRLEREEVGAVLFAADRAGLAESVAACARSAKIPVVAFTTGNQQDLPARFDALGALSAMLQTKKLIFVTRRGGLRNRTTDAYLSIVNLMTDYERLVTEKALSPKQQSLLSYARRLIVEQVSHSMLVAITSPLQLLRELFTVKGAGTLIKRGSTILKKDCQADLDVTRLDALLTSAFGRRPVDGFFDRPALCLYVEESYRGMALLRETPLGAYLCKFAVERAAQGEGIGRDLWEVMTRDFPCLFWRGRAKNPLGAFYAQECDGLARFPEWTVYWKGLAPERIPDAIAFSLAQPIDLTDAQTG
jgi:acetylglutamate kinase